MSRRIRSRVYPKHLVRFAGWNTDDAARAEAACAGEAAHLYTSKRTPFRRNPSGRRRRLLSCGAGEWSETNPSASIQQLQYGHLRPAAASYGASDALRRGKERLCREAKQTTSSKVQSHPFAQAATPHPHSHDPLPSTNETISGGGATRFSSR
jgi:hypothetical protein